MFYNSYNQQCSFNDNFINTYIHTYIRTYISTVLYNLSVLEFFLICLFSHLHADDTIILSFNGSCSFSILLMTCLRVFAAISQEHPCNATARGDNVFLHQICFFIYSI